MGLGLWVWLEMEMEMAGFGWRGLGFSSFDQGGDRWSFLYCLVDCDSD